MQFRSALALFGLASVLAPTAPAFAAKDTLTIGIAQFPSSLHPDIDAEVVKKYADGFVIRQITAFDKDWKNSCLLCTELPTIQNGLAKIEDLPDGKKGIAVTIKLKPDLKWSDGVPVTTKDLAFTFKVGKDPNSGFSNVNRWDRATKIDVVDDHTAVIHMTGITPSFNQWDEIIPEHVEGPIYDKATGAGEYLKQTLYNRAPTSAGLYDGPYKITEYQSGAQIVMEPNPYWSGTKPGFKRIILKHIENTAALQANLLSGDVDMVAGEGIGLTIDQVLELRKQHPDDFTYIFKPSLTYEHVDLQKDNPIFKDVKVRQALLYALDRKTLTEKLFQGLQPVAATWVNPLNPNYTKDTAQYPYDLAKAKSLLAEAGWKPGSDGICRNAAGDRLSFELSTTAGNRLRELQEQVLQSQWKAACIDATIKNEPPRTIFGETLKKRIYPGMVMYGWSSAVTESPLRTLGTSQIPTEKNNYGGANYIAFSNPDMDAAIARMDSELEPEKQKADWAIAQKIYADQVPVVPLFFRSEPHIVPKWLKGYEPTGHGDFACMWSENWHAE
ncbi:MAG TPA: peptide ABC transporter substrate-binding protein [Aliidongia sp.]|uniref:peptide ABC transporter substrate-binding protein n=1 Tax=Aliidongia sp. TaxID=1914230 RepID=UPI002DDCB03C|nr:peptide ABC transporter substrate-binding protein [Aliidongia sp.]HEV2675806.1 peptide ABC transporter substrate-binding protein [Aliidongia sp.]